MVRTRDGRSGGGMAEWRGLRGARGRRAGAAMVALLAPLLLMLPGWVATGVSGLATVWATARHVTSGPTVPPPPLPGVPVAPQATLLSPSGAPNNYFGDAVALSGDSALVGEPGATSQFGAAYVFTRSATTWSLQGILTPNTGYHFGDAVALSGDTALIATAGTNSSTGATFVMLRSGTNWHRQATLTAADGATGDNFGDAVALSGDTAVIGADQKNNAAGAAYVFTRSGTTWRQQAVLTAPRGAPRDLFGATVAVDGATILVGAPGTNNATGAVYVFTRSGIAWRQQAVLTAPRGAQNDAFGLAVALSGATALVGAPDRNAAYVFTAGGAAWRWQATLRDDVRESYFGSALALSGATALIGADQQHDLAGAAYVFTRAGTTWRRQAVFTAPTTGWGGTFGRAVALDGSRALVAAPGTQANAGAVYVFGPRSAAR